MMQPSTTFPASLGSRLLRDPVIHLQVLVALAIALGGGGVRYGLANLAIQLVALAVLGLHFQRVCDFARNGPRGLQVLLVATLLVPLLQIVPLPPALWQALPQRELVAQSYEIAGIDAQAWTSFSVDRMRTVVAFCGLLAPLSIILLGATLAREERYRIGQTVIVAALAVFLFGAVQLTNGNTLGMLYPERIDSSVLYGTFTNRNSTGLFFVLSVLLLAALPLAGRAQLLATAAIAVLLCTGVVLTQSRSSMVLLVLALGFAVLRGAWVMSARLRSPARQGGARWIIAATLFAVLIGALAFSALSTGRASDALARFDDTTTDRPEMWEDSLYVAEQFLPLGTGMGTFDEVFQVYESLEYVSARRAGRAHSDVLEIAIEGGVVALAMAALWLGWVGVNALRAAGEARRWDLLGAGLGAGCIFAQSLLDYPLRNQSLLCVAAVLVVLLARSQRAMR